MNESAIEYCKVCYCDHAPKKHVSLDDVKRNVLLHVLQETGGNKTKTAEILQVHIRTVQRLSIRFS